MYIFCTKNVFFSEKMQKIKNRLHYLAKKMQKNYIFLQKNIIFAKNKKTQAFVAPKKVPVGLIFFLVKNSAYFLAGQFFCSWPAPLAAVKQCRRKYTRTIFTSYFAFFCNFWQKMRRLRQSSGAVVNIRARYLQVFLHFFVSFGKRFAACGSQAVPL